MNIRERLLNPPIRIEPVELDADTTLYLRPIKESDFSVMESEIFDPVTGKTIPAKFEAQRRRLLSLALCDEYGKLLFEPNESPSLGGMDSDEAMFLHDEYRRLFPRQKRPPVKSLVKNSEPVSAYD